ncbi:MAG TPA: heavy metal translocating P-type ATPase [Anaerolineales bacterium]|nr:heavy metal translocating P-type ATPase [Anaerolineales bacterium]
MNTVKRFLIERFDVIFVFITLVSMMAGWWAENQAAPFWVVWLCFGIAYLTGGYSGFVGGIQALREWKIDVDLLMILAAVGAALIGQPFEGALLLFLFSLSNVLQDFAMRRTRRAIQAMMQLRPDSANVRRKGGWVNLPLEEIQLGDVFLLRPGERIALDGVVLVGESSVNQASVTGESIPVSKYVGDNVLAGTLNENGSLEVQVSKLATESTLAKMIQLVEEAQNAKANTQRWLDTFEQYYATGVVIFTVLMVVVPYFLLQQPFQPTFYRAMTLLVAMSPCALVISTPASILSAIGNGAMRGILFKGGASVEQAAELKAVAFDKTGTLTVGKPTITDVLPAAELTADEVLSLAASVEALSEHPLAQAVVNYVKGRNLPIPTATTFQAVTGKGAFAQVNGDKIHIGSPRYLTELGATLPADLDAQLGALQDAGKTAILIARERAGEAPQLLGILALADVLRPNAAQIVQSLKKLGIAQVVMLTGDNERVARAIAKQVGVDRFYADLMPADKVTRIKELKAEFGKVGMVGDGVNDAPALATADIGIAMGAAGSDVALETADIVLMSDDISKIPYVFGLSRATRRTLYFNLGLAMLAILIMVVTIFWRGLPLPLAVLGHEGGTVLVSLNGLRLLAYRSAQYI